MDVLIACESSGTVRSAFRCLGHNAISCDLLPADDNSPHHIQGDAIDAINSRTWDMVIAHPPCTYLSSSGLHWNHRRPGRAEQTAAAVEFFMAVVEACNKQAAAWAIENPIGCMSRLYRKPDQIIQPWQFGEDASKATCLWLHNLPMLKSTAIVPGRLVCCGLPVDDKYGCPNCNGDETPLYRWANQTDSGQNRLPPTADRWKQRSKTYPGIAEAMAEQWKVLQETKTP